MVSSWLHIHFTFPSPASIVSSRDVYLEPNGPSESQGSRDGGGGWLRRWRVARMIQAGRVEAPTVQANSSKS